MVLTDIEDVAAALSSNDTSKVQQYLSELVDWLVDKAFDMLIAVIFLFIGFRISKLIVKLIRNSFTRAGMEHSVSGFLISLIRGALYAIVFIMAAAIVGFQVTSLVTILGTASLAIGLALQGSLANFAGGVLILIMKPFKVGDYIIENDKNCEGTVASIDIFYTKLKTVDNKIIVIPNGNITANSLINLTAEGVRRLDITVGVAYNSDILKAKKILLGIIEASPYLIADMEKAAFVDALMDSQIQMGARFYVKTDNYWKAKWEVNEEILKQFADNRIEIPYNKLDVNILEQNKND